MYYVKVMPKNSNIKYLMCVQTQCTYIVSKILTSMSSSSSFFLRRMFVSSSLSSMDRSSGTTKENVGHVSYKECLRIYFLHDRNVQTFQLLKVGLRAVKRPMFISSSLWHQTCLVLIHSICLSAKFNIHSLHMPLTYKWESVRYKNINS